MKDFLEHQPLTYLITSGESNPDNFSIKSQEILNIIEKAVIYGISLIQIREKNLSARLLLELTARAVELTTKSNTKLLVNDRADVAFSAEADGVHLTSNSIPTEIIRQNYPKDFIIGVSTHSLEKIQFEQKSGADFAVFSPIFKTPNKGEPKGLENLKAVCENVKPFPILALGGINESNYLEVLKYGASGIATIRFLNNEENLRELTIRFQKYNDRKN